MRGLLFAARGGDLLGRRPLIKLVRFAGPEGTALGLVDGRTVHVLAETEPLDVLRGARTPTGETIEAVDAQTLELPEPHELLAPIVPPETWAAGVTYERSRRARVEESHVQDVYSLVYEAERPEVFLKDAGGRRTVGPGGTIGVRSDGLWTVPEPELALVLDEDGALLGATIGNDVTARDIEGANPLYLPQAKIYAGACAIGPAIVVPDTWAAPFDIELEIEDAGGELVWSAATSTARMKRSFEELAAWVVRENPIPAGSVLLTGTGLVPPDEIALAPGHVVEVRIPGIGRLRNAVGTAADLAQRARSVIDV